MNKADIAKALKKDLSECRWLVRQKRFYGVLGTIAAKLSDHEFYPSVDKIFAPFTILEKSPRLVIVATDPYPNEGMATGIPFAVSDSYEGRFPRSLEILKRVLPVGNGRRSDWIKWAREERVLLLNRSLTRFRCDRHATFGVWDRFIEAMINEILCLNPEVVFWLMGDKAKHLNPFSAGKITKDFGKQVIYSCHPSYVHCVGGAHCKCYKCFAVKRDRVINLIRSRSCDSPKSRGCLITGEIENGDR